MFCSATIIKHHMHYLMNGMHTWEAHRGTTTNCFSPTTTTTTTTATAKFNMTVLISFDYQAIRL
jgi:3-mercaptopyruvate sulfurtransferase SseA